MEPEDILRTVGWKHMKFRNIIQLCQTNSLFSNLCEEESTWRFLIGRDFYITSNTDDPRRDYIKHLIRARAESELMDAEDRLKYIDIYPQDSLGIYKTVVHQQKFALSLLGIDTSNVYFDFYGNKIGSYAKKTIDDETIGYNKQFRYIASPLQFLALGTKF